MPGKSHGPRSLVGCSPWGCEESDTTERPHFHALEKAMATHSSVLAWRIPGMVEPGGVPSMGSHRVGHDSSDLAAAVWCLSHDSCSYHNFTTLPNSACRISTSNSLLWADAAKRMDVLFPCSFQSGVMVSPREGQAAGIFHLSQLHVHAGMAKKTWSLFFQPAPTLICARQAENTKALIAPNLANS